MKKVTFDYAMYNHNGAGYAENIVSVNVCDKIANQIHTEMAEEDDNAASAILNGLADVLAKAAGYDYGHWCYIEDVEDVAE